MRKNSEILGKTLYVLEEINEFISGSLNDYGGRFTYMQNDNVFCYLHTFATCISDGLYILILV